MRAQIGIPDDEKRNLKNAARVHLVAASALVFQAIQKLQKCNARRFDQTTTHRELIAMERKLTRIQAQVEGLDL